MPRPVVCGRVFCLERDSYPWEKPCHDTRRPLSRPKHSGPLPNPAMTQNFCRDTRLKKKALSLPKPPSMPGNNVATQRPLSQHKARKLCRVRIPAGRTCLSREPKSGRAPDLRTQSRHRRPCHDTGPKKPCRDRKFSVTTEDLKWAPSLFLVLHSQLSFNAFSCSTIAFIKIAHTV